MVLFWLKEVQRDVAGNRKAPGLFTDLVQYPLAGWCCCWPWSRSEVLTLVSIFAVNLVLEGVSW